MATTAPLRVREAPAPLQRADEPAQPATESELAEIGCAAEDAGLNGLLYACLDTICERRGGDLFGKPVRNDARARHAQRVS